MKPAAPVTRAVVGIAVTELAYPPFERAVRFRRFAIQYADRLRFDGLNGHASRKSNIDEDGKSRIRAAGAAMRMM